MYPAVVPWIANAAGAQAQIGQLGLLIVRKVKIDFEIVVFGKALQARSLTIDDGKERAEAAARKWVAQAIGALWTKDQPDKETPPRTQARPGGIGKRAGR